MDRSLKRQSMKKWAQPHSKKQHAGDERPRGKFKDNPRTKKWSTDQTSLDD